MASASKKERVNNRKRELGVRVKAPNVCAPLPCVWAGWWYRRFLKRIKDGALSRPDSVCGGGKSDLEKAVSVPRGRTFRSGEL